MVSYVESFGELITKTSTKALTIKILEEELCALKVVIPGAETGATA
jgi:hypothetical protein